MIRLNTIAIALFMLCIVKMQAAGPWQAVKPEIAATCLALDNKGTLYAIDTGHHLFFLERDSIAWKPMLKSKMLKSVSVSPDGTILVLDKDKPYGYERPAGAKWESKAMDLKHFVFSNNGIRCMLSNDGRVYFNGKMLTGSFQNISPMQQADGIYLLSIDKIPYRYANGDISPQKLPGSATADVIAGTGYSGKGSQYILDRSNGKLMGFDPGNSLLWEPIVTPVPFIFIALDANGVLYGVGTDHRIYKKPG